MIYQFTAKKEISAFLLLAKFTRPVRNGRLNKLLENKKERKLLEVKNSSLHATYQHNNNE